MKNSSSSFNIKTDELDSNIKSMSNSSFHNLQHPGMFKKFSQTTNEKLYFNHVQLNKLNDNNNYAKKPLEFNKKKQPYPTSMENFCSQQNNLSFLKQYKYKKPSEQIIQDKKYNYPFPKTCFSGNNLYFIPKDKKRPSFIGRNSVTYSNLNNLSYCSNDFKLDNARPCLSKQKTPERKSVNQKQNFVKLSHARHVSSYATFTKVPPKIQYKIDSTPKLSNYQRPYKTSIRQFDFPDNQHETNNQIASGSHFKKETEFHNDRAQKLQKNKQIQKLEFEKQKIDNSVNMISPPHQEIQDSLQVTARFNFAQDNFSVKLKGLSDTATSLQNSISPRKPIHLSQFILGPCKGKGRYGKVYFAIDRQTGFICALKQMPLSLVRQMLPQFINQIKIQSFLDHPYITKIYGFFIDNQNIYIIMEYMTDGTLYDLIKKRGPLPQPLVATKILQASQALSHMHSYHIIHRDLKPQNIVITCGVCKICDFGWSVKCYKKRQTSCGTLDYLSPEMIQGTGYSSSIDLWAMGVLLYEMLVGKPPFYNISVKQTAKKIKQCEFTLPQKLSEESKSLIECFLRKNPGERREIDGILRHPFFQNVEE